MKLYQEKDMVRVAKRENNTKRKYLVINALQGKHIPVSATETFEMFDTLAEELIHVYSGKKVLVVGFAETATAIGARIAVKMDSLYMQTTRENIKNVEYLYFTESHSHATEQKLIKTDLDKIIDEVEYIIFAEDEVTTGNTIMKIIRIIQQTYEKEVKFAVASLLNGMDEEAEKNYEENGIRRHYLVKTNHSSYTKIADSYQGDGEYITDIENVTIQKIRRFTAKDYLDSRRLVQGGIYDEKCESLWKQIESQIEYSAGERILVLGTEEFMYPAIYTAYRFCQSGCQARTHSTTRSPIVVSSEAEYPLHCRYELRSLYDDQRRTFIYDIDCYDKVIIITDSKNTSENGLNDLCKAVVLNGNSNIQVVRWCKE